MARKSLEDWGSHAIEPNIRDGAQVTRRVYRIHCDLSRCTLSGRTSIGSDTWIRDWKAWEALLRNLESSVVLAVRAVVR